jgi:thiol:disulfide interchange protein DsbD
MRSLRNLRPRTAFYAQGTVPLPQRRCDDVVKVGLIAAPQSRLPKRPVGAALTRAGTIMKTKNLFAPPLRAWLALLLAMFAMAGTALAALPGVASDDDEFLPVREAFRLVVDRSEDAFVARWAIADHYYIYRERLRFALVDAQGNAIAGLGEPQVPAGEMKDDEVFGRVEVYHHELAVRLPVTTLPPDGSATLKVTYQGCAEAGLCYAPETEEWPLDFSGMKVAAATPATTPAATPVASPAAGAQGASVSAEPAVPSASGLSATDSNAIARFLAGASFLAIVGTFLLLGMGLAFTPCVLPMVPILSSIIVGEGDAITPRRAFLLSLAYVLGMALTYTAAGIAVGFLGAKANVAVWLQSPVVLGVFAALFVALAMSMFGFYELQVPSFLRDRLTAAQGKQKAGSLVGVAVMGALSALVVSPCVSAPLAGALVFISSTGDAVLGGAALFALAMGMGIPLLLIGTSGGKLLPKAGSWMNGVKVFFGVMLLGIAIILLGRVLPGPLTLALWGVLLLISGVFLKPLEALAEFADGWAHFRKGVGLVLMFTGALMLVGAAGGGDDPLKPLGFLAGSSAQAATGAAGTEKPLFTRVANSDELATKLAEAKAAGKPVMLDFFAEWCVACKIMERDVFSRPAVHAALAGYVVLQADVTGNSADNRALLARHEVLGLPSVLFFRADGAEVSGERIQGELDEAQFLAHLSARITPALD